jgi:C-terminal processing protease CtpA/Prc
MMFTSWHADYHKSGDHAEKIAYPNLARIARAAFRIILETGNLERGLRLNPDVPLGGKPLRIRGEDEAGKGAFTVTEVAEGSPLAQAGLKAGDRVIGIGGQPLPAERPLAEFWRRVQGSKFDQPLQVEIERAGAKSVLTATFPRKQ